MNSQDNTPQGPSAAKYRVAVAIALAVTLLSGVVHGYLDGRWSTPADLIEIGSRLDEIPDQLGHWKVVKHDELNEAAQDMLRCYGSIVRNYQDDRTGATVIVAILFGPRGPISVHTPEICYSSVGTKQVGPTQLESISTPTARHSLWSVQFRRVPDPEPSDDVWYAWSDGGKWEASNYPRFWLTENLYKIQVAGPVGDTDRRPCRDFLEEFLPEVEKIMN